MAGAAACAGSVGSRAEHVNLDLSGLTTYTTHRDAISSQPLIRWKWIAFASPVHQKTARLAGNRMKLSTLLLGALSCVPAHAAPAKDGNFSVTCTLTEKRQVTGGMLVGTKMAPQRVKVHKLEGGFTLRYQGVIYSSPRLDAEGVVSTPEGQQYIYSKHDRAFSVAGGDKYLELSKCK